MADNDLPDDLIPVAASQQELPDDLIPIQSDSPGLIEQGLDAVVESYKGALTGIGQSAQKAFPGPAQTFAETLAQPLTGAKAFFLDIPFGALSLPLAPAIDLATWALSSVEAGALKATEATLRAAGVDLGPLEKSIPYGDLVEKIKPEMAIALSMVRPRGSLKAMAERSATAEADVGERTNVHAGEDSIPLERVGEQGPERIIRAAIRFDDDIYTGNVHIDAVELAAKKLGKSVDEITNLVESKDDGAGFLTSKGRYVDRAEAMRIAESQGQIKEGHKPANPEDFVAEEIRSDTEKPRDALGNRTWLDNVRDTLKEPDLTEARNLGVIGEEKPPLTDGTPEEAGRRVIPPELPGEPPPPGTPGGPPEKPSPWRQRFEETLDKMETSDDAKAVIMNAVDRNNEFPVERRGDLSAAEVQTLSEATGIDSTDIDPAATGKLFKNNEQMRNIVQAMRTLDDKIRNIAEQIASKEGVGDGDMLDELARLKLQRETVTDAAVKPFVALRAEFGRAGNVLQEFMKAKKAGEDVGDFMRNKQGATKDDLRNMARMLANTPAEDMAGVMAKLRLQPPGAWYWTWVQGLISGIVTHTKYLVANELFATVIHGVETPVAAAIGKFKEAAGLGDAEAGRVFATESVAGLIGHFASVPSAFMAAGRAFKTGIKPPLKSEVALFNEAIERQKAAIAAGEKPEKIPLALQRSNAQIPQLEPENFKILPFTDPEAWYNVASRKLVSTPGRMANAIHTFFRVTGEAASIQGQAVRQTIKEGKGLLDSDFLSRQRELTANPTEAMSEQAVKDAYYSTFMQDLGPAGKAWQRATREVPGLRWLFPFMHIPVNILKAGIERTPFAFAGPEMRANLLGERGSIAQDTAISRMVVGSTVMGYFAYKYLNGQATGDYPADPKERLAWKIAGKVPNSILIGNNWYSFNKFGPAGTIANLGANFGSIWETYQHGDDDAYASATWKAAQAAGHFVSDEVGFQGLANIFEALQNENKAVALTSTTAATAIPFSSMFSQFASIHDPDMREIKTFFDGIKYRIPLARETLMPKRDWLGDPVPNSQYGSVIRQAEMKDDPITQEALYLGTTYGKFPAPPPDRISGIKLTPEIYDQYQSVAGAMAKTALETLVRQPGWYDMPVFAREEMFQNTIRMSRQIGAATIQAQHPEIIQQGIDNKRREIMGEKPQKKLVPSILP